MEKFRSSAFYFLTIFLGCAFADVTEFLHVCGRRDPNINLCVQESIQSLTETLKTGIPELDVSPLEPLFIEEIKLSDLESFNAKAKDCYVSGLSNYTIKHLAFSVVGQSINMQMAFPVIKVDCNYDVKARILVPIHEKGPITAINERVDAKVTMQYTLRKHKGKMYMYFSKMTTKLEVGDYHAYFTPSTGPNHPLTEALNSVLENNKQELIGSTLPNIERAVSFRVLEVSNKICKHFTYDELLPNRE